MDLDYIRKLAGITPTDTYEAFDEDVDGWYSDDELIEELQEFLASPELCFLAEKKKGGFIAKAKAALSSLFGKKKAAAKKAPAKKAASKAAAKAAPKETPAKSKGGGKASAEPKRKLAPDEKMVFGVIRKIGKNGKLLPKDDAKKKSASKEKPAAGAASKAAEPEKKAAAPSGGGASKSSAEDDDDAEAKRVAAATGDSVEKAKEYIKRDKAEKAARAERANKQFEKDGKLPDSYSPQEKDPKDPRKEVTKKVYDDGDGGKKAVIASDLPGGIEVSTFFDSRNNRYETMYFDKENPGRELAADYSDPGDVKDIEDAQKKALALAYSARRAKQVRKETGGDGYESIAPRYSPIAERMNMLLRKQRWS